MTYSLNPKTIAIFVFILFFTGQSISCFAESMEEDADKKTISGRLQGLKDGELLLELYGNEDLKLVKDGSFSFKSPVAAHEKLNVSIKRLPVNHRCEIHIDQDTKGNKTTNDLEINCTKTGSWVHPSSLDDHLSLPGQNTRTPITVADDNGNGIVLWSQFDGANWRIYKAEYRENKWVKSADLADAISPKGGDAKDPRVAMSANGDVVIVWEQTYNKSSFIYMAEKRGSKWRLPASLDNHISPGDKYAWEPDVAMDDSGNTIIVWDQEYENSVHVLYKSEYRDSKWYHPISKDDYMNPYGGDALHPRVVMNNHGVALIVWEQDPQGLSNIYTKVNTGILNGHIQLI